MKNICKLAIAAVALIHIAKIFFPVDLLFLLFGVTLVLLITALPLQGPGFKKITLAFLLTGSLILISYQVPMKSWMQPLVSMTNIIAIIVVMQFFTLPIALGEYSQTVEYWLQKSFKTESSLFLFAMLVTNAFSSFLLFGTVPVMVSLFSKALKNNVSHYQRFLAAAIVRGYSMALFWAPGAVIILLVLQVTNISWFDLFLPGFLLSLIGIATSYVLERFTWLNKPLMPVKADEMAGSERAALAAKQSVHIILVVLGLVLLVSGFEILQLGSGTGRILLAGLTVSGIWLFYYRHHRELRNCLAKYWQGGIIKAADLSAFFIAMGLFAGAIDQTGILGQFQPLFQASANHLGLFSMIVVPVVFILLAITGIHPFILTIIFGKILLALSLPLSTVSIALLLLLASSISFIASPFAGMVLMTAKFLNVKPVEVAFKWNSVYCTIFLAEGIVFAYLWG